MFITCQTRTSSTLLSQGSTAHCSQGPLPGGSGRIRSLARGPALGVLTPGFPSFQRPQSLADPQHLLVWACPCGLVQPSWSGLTTVVTRTAVSYYWRQLLKRESELEVKSLGFESLLGTLFAVIYLSKPLRDCLPGEMRVWR